jgi:eukaryotic-like serine/threonine-protein kinase
VRQKPDVHCDRCVLEPNRGAPAAAVGAYVDGRYLVDRVLGSGAMGTVLLARDAHLDRRVAIKLLPTGATPRQREGFEREARALASVRHDCVVGVHSFGVHGSSLFFAMEYVDGAPLGAIIAEHARHGTTVPLHRALDVLMRVSSGLSAVHGVGILHRDVKPENIVIEAETGRPVLVDFGLAIAQAEATSSAAVAGTPAFMAPECIRGEPATIRSDVYSLACAAYELLVGHVPFEGTLAAVMHAHLEREPEPPSRRYAWLEPFDHVIGRALAKDPAVRHHTALAFRADLEAAGRSALAQPEPILSSQVTELVPVKDDALRVLVVDDDPVFVRIAVRAAQIAFADVQVAVSRAKSGPAAIENARRWLPQLVLLDYRLPEMDGAEVLSRIRSLQGGEGVAVIVISGAVGDDTRWRFAVLGVRHFLPKPIEFPDLVTTIVQLGRRRGWIPLERSEHETIER